MKILTAEQMRRVDRLTVERAGVSFQKLMENAGRRLTDFLVEEFLPNVPRTAAGPRITVLCGKGNNGGDALVAARHLRELGSAPRVALLASADALKGDACAACDAFLQAGGKVEALATPAEWARERDGLLDCDVVVDALLGTGLSGPVEGLLAEVIADVNARRARYRVVAVDIPSGLASDSGEPLGESIAADATLTFTAPKLGLIFPPNCFRAGRLAVAPIGTPEELLAGDADFWLNLIVPRQFARLPLRRPPAAHKGDFGHVLLVAGSRGKSGAAVLGGRGALRAGAGLVTVATAASAQPTVAAPVPELMTEPMPETEAGSISRHAFDYGNFARLAENKTVVALGPGLSLHPETAQFVRTVVEELEKPLVLDADALNALVGQLDSLRKRRSPLTVLTPHPGEMARLLGSTTGEVQRQRVEVARNFARAYGVFVILKGFRTLVATPAGEVYVNPAGNPGMATAGMGDVLTGLLAGVLAQWPAAPTEDVLSLGVFLHGRAADLAAQELGEEALLATDAIEALPRCWRQLHQTIERDRPGDTYLLP
jgi:NAD(P)H-hydrate epimerase